MPHSFARSQIGASNKLIVVGIAVGQDSWEMAKRLAGELRQRATTDGTPIAIVLATHGSPEGAPSANASEQSSPVPTGWSGAGWTELAGDDCVTLQPGHVYFQRLGGGLELEQDRLCVKRLDASKQAAPIDHFFNSLANDKKEYAVGVVLSGTGSDGTLGLRSIADSGGMTIAESPATAAEQSMPRSAAKLGSVDHVLPREAIASEICYHAQHMQEFDDTDDSAALNRQILVAIPQITAAVEKHTQNDFKHYKTTTLTRRIRRRMHVLKLTSVEEYVDLLGASREEALRLFRDLLISVTSFFRDPRAFESLSKDVLTPLIQRHEGTGPLRIWVPGCATGQEAYSIAILLAEMLEQSQHKLAVQIFATDLDQRALSIARTASFPIGIQDEVAQPRLDKYFVKRGNRYFVTKAIRDMVVFSVHNLISDPPFTKLDLISCRNLLIYLGSHLQKKLIPLFHYAIKPGGFLFLGPAETLSVNRELFRTLHTKHRIYQRRVTALDPPRELDIPLVNLKRFGGDAEDASGEVDLFRYAQQVILGEFSPQWVVVDDEGQVQTLSSDPAPFLKMSAGQFKNNIIAMAHENLRIGLRGAFSEAKKHRRRALAEGMSVPVEGGLQRVHITVQPMPELGHDAYLHLVVFHRIGTPLQVGQESGADEQSVAGADGGKVVDTSANQVIEQLELELSRTRAALERTVQELESSNEELKSSNEELLSMYEEMQSANEELETSKEELQTSNESLLRINNDTQNLLRSTQVAAIFLDNGLRIRGFTPAVTEIYALVESDVGRRLTQFAPVVENMPPLPDPQLLPEDGAAEEVIGEVNGRTYIRRVIPYHAPDGQNDGMVVTFNDVTELSSSQQLFKSLVDVSAQIVWIADSAGSVSEDSPSWRDFTGQTFEQWVGRGWLQAIHPEDRQATAQRWSQALQSEETFATEYRLMHKSGEYRWTEVRAVANRSPSGQIYRWVGMNTDINQRHQFQQSLEAAKAQAEAANLSKSAFLANMSHEIRTPMTAILGYIDLIADHVADPETSSYIRTIRRNGDFLLEIINDILDLSKIEAGKLEIAQEIFSPDRLIEDVRSIMNVRATEGGIELEVEYQKPLPALVLSDAKRIKQILINLVGNAIKFTSRGSVTIVVDYVPAEDVKSDGLAASSLLRFDIVDTGIGMSDKLLERLFQPFCQGDASVTREFGGTGLGLAITDRLAEMLGGEISVMSELGRGSKFSVSVAVAEVDHAATASRQTSASSLPQPTDDDLELKIDADILIVDDRRDIRFLSNSFLSKSGARVSEAEDGEVAIRAVQQAMDAGKPFRLILLDMQMPRMDGYETAQELRRLGFTGPIIALTADAMQGDMHRCLAAGCNDYLSKPIDRQTMLQKVYYYLENSG